MIREETECTNLEPSGRPLEDDIHFPGLDEASNEILRQANIVLPAPVTEIQTEEFRQLIDAVVWDKRSWTDPETHVYALGRDRHTKLPRKTARINFRNRRVQLSVVLMKIFRDPQIQESTVRLRNGCEDKMCVNPFHFHMDTKRMERRRKTMKLRARPGSFLERRMNTNSWASIQCDYMPEFSCGDETPSLRSSPSSAGFSSMASEFSDDDEEYKYSS